MTINRRAVVFLIALMMVPAMTAAEVSRVEIVSRRDVLAGRAFGSAGAYELIVSKVHFAVDPAAPRNRVVVDLEKAPRNAAGLVELTADLSILKPKDQARGNSVALIDIVNRGRRTVLTSFNRATGAGDLSTDAEFGDGLLMRQGFTLVWVGWEFDVPRRDGVTRIDVPAATGVSGVVRAFLTPDARRPEVTFGDLAGYSPSDPAASSNTLTVRDGMQGTPTTIARDRWQLAGNVVTLEGGFEPGRTYELAYTAANLPVSGLGFVAVRDTASWLKYANGCAGCGEVRLRVRVVSKRPLPAQLPVRRLQHRREESSGVRRRHGQHRRRCAHRLQRTRRDADRARPIHGDVVSVRRQQAAGCGHRSRRWRAGESACPRTPAENLLHEHRRRVLGRRPLGRVDPHDA
jgi:hypothetical protein